MKAEKLSERRKFQLAKNKDIISVEFQSTMKQIFFLIIALAAFGTVASAQTASCNLRLGVYKFQIDVEPTEIKSEAAFLQKEKSKVKIKSVMQNEMPYFANLPAGNYSAVVSLKDYKITSKEIRLNCDLADEQGIVSEVVFLWEGNSKEKIQMTNKTMTALDHGAKLSENGEINRNAVFLPKPVYPRAAAAVKAVGTVQIQVLLNEIGKVVYAKAVSGHPLLQAASIKAAREAKFSMTTLQGIPVKVSGIITYNFVP
jgi:TonB family protein